MAVEFDLVLDSARLPGRRSTVDIGIRGGLIVAVSDALDSEGPRDRIESRLVLPGLIETHIHLDKSGLMERCACSLGTLGEAIEAVAAAKRDFTEEDVYRRAAHTIERSILQGTTRMRTHVEVDPRIGLTSVHALLRIKRDYAWAIDLQLCAFPQEGLLDDPGCEDVLVAALEAGCDVVGGAPYMDRDSHGQIARIFAIARRFDIDIDFHLDFGLDPKHLDVIEVCRLTDELGWAGRVTVGHVTKFSSVPPARFEQIGRMLAASGVAVTVLPSTDLYLTGRDHDHDVPRGVTPAHRLIAQGVTCSLSTNNVLNPFTPFGDCSLIRMANLYANIAQVGTPDGMATCLDMVTGQSAKILRLDDYGIAPGMAADFVVFDCATGDQAVAELAQPLRGYRRGRQTFERPAGRLLRPE